MCKSLFCSLHFSCSCRNAKTGSVVDIPGLKPNWLSLMFTISLSRASVIHPRSFMKKLDSPVIVAFEDVTIVFEYAKCPCFVYESCCYGMKSFPMQFLP